MAGVYSFFGGKRSKMRSLTGMGYGPHTEHGYASHLLDYINVRAFQAKRGEYNYRTNRYCPLRKSKTWHPIDKLVLMGGPLDQQSPGKGVETFVKWLRKQSVGPVVESEPKDNLRHDERRPGQKMYVVYIWSPDEEKVKAWYKANKDLKSYQFAGSGN